MKKTYMQPKTKTVKIATVVMNTVSVGADMATGSADGRGTDSLWDDEE
jgi:hypothetical protein